MRLQSENQPDALVCGWKSNERIAARDDLDEQVSATEVWFASRYRARRAGPRVQTEPWLYMVYQHPVISG